MCKDVAVGETRWYDLTPEKISFELSKLSKKFASLKNAKSLGVTIVAGEAAYCTIRQIFPEDTAIVKIKSCSYLEREQCLVIKDTKFPIGRMF